MKNHSPPSWCYGKKRFCIIKDSVKHNFNTVKDISSLNCTFNIQFSKKICTLNMYRFAKTVTVLVCGPYVKCTKPYKCYCKVRFRTLVNALAYGSVR